MTPIDIVDRARVFASAAHAAVDQRRKFTNDPYIVHPEGVAMILRSHCSNPPPDWVLAVAWLHDVVEDTKVSIHVIEEHFGAQIANGVRQVTKITTPEMGNREARKKIDLAHYSNGGWEAQTVKLADIAHNCRDIADRDRSFATIYLKEQRALAEALTRGDAKLRAYCLITIAKNEDKLGIVR